MSGLAGDPAALGELKEAAQSALIYAIIGDREKCVEPLGAIVEMSAQAVHGALCGWSGLTLSVFEQDEGAPGDGEFWAIEAEDIETGEPRSIDEASAAERAALCFVTCFGNKDYATTTAIVKAVYDDPQALAELLFQSVTLAAEAAKVLKERREAA